MGRWRVLDWISDVWKVSTSGSIYGSLTKLSYPVGYIILVKEACKMSIVNYVRNGPRFDSGKQMLAGSLLWWRTWITVIGSLSVGFVLLLYIPQSHAAEASLYIGISVGSLFWMNILMKMADVTGITE